jgi:hypothetical protein
MFEFAMAHPWLTFFMFGAVCFTVEMVIYHTWRGIVEIVEAMYEEDD